MKNIFLIVLTNFFLFFTVEWFNETAVPILAILNLPVFYLYLNGLHCVSAGLYLSPFQGIVSLLLTSLVVSSYFIDSRFIITVYAFAYLFLYRIRYYVINIRYIVAILSFIMNLCIFVSFLVYSGICAKTAIASVLNEAWPSIIFSQMVVLLIGPWFVKMQKFILYK